MSNLLPERKNNQRIRLILTGLILSGLQFLGISDSKAQSVGVWSQQKAIPDYRTITEEPPYLIADQNHAIHAFNSQPIDLTNEESPLAIYYRRWTYESGWASLNDIIYDATGRDSELIGVAYDETGTVHLVFQRDEELFYTQSLLANAADARSWTRPFLIADSSTRSGPGLANVGSVATDISGQQIIVIYSGDQIRSGLYFTYSPDSGQSWTTPYPVKLEADNTLVVTDPKLIASESGKFHSVWTTFYSDGFGGPGYYANFNSTTRVWSDAVTLDSPGIRTPSMIEYEDAMYVSYHHIKTNGNWWRRSFDEGLSWSVPRLLSQNYVGTNGNVSFVIDGGNVLHAFFGNRIDEFNEHGMWHSYWTGNAWTNPEAVVRGPQVKDAPGGKGFDPRSARAVVSNGNLVFVAWGTDGAAGLNGAWYSYQRLNVPELPSISQPVPMGPTLQTIPSESDPVQIPQVIGSLTPTIGLSAKYDDSRSELQDSQFPIWIGTLIVILLLARLLFSRIQFKSDR